MQRKARIESIEDKMVNSEDPRDAALVYVAGQLMMTCRGVWTELAPIIEALKATLGDGWGARDCAIAWERMLAEGIRRVARQIHSQASAS